MEVLKKERKSYPNKPGMGGGSHAGRVALTVLLVLIATAVFSQPYVSRQGRFQVDQIKGCAPFTVTITNANLITTGECTGLKPCVMTFESTQQQNAFVYTYNTPGTFKLSVLYQSQQLGADDIMITVLPNIQPDFEIYACSSKGVTVNIKDKNYDQYFINFGDGSPVIGIPFSNNQTATHTYPAATTYTISVHGKDLNSADDCNALNQSFTALNALPAPKINKLTAKQDTLVADFTVALHLELKLEIAINNSSNFQTYQTLYGVNTVVLPAMAPDKNFYCLRLSAFDPCTGTNTYSNIICSSLLTVTPQNNQNAIGWTTPSAGITNYTIARNGAAYVTTPGQNFNDTGVECTQQYCYNVTSHYANGSTSISLTQCAVALRTDTPTLIHDVSAVVGDKDNKVDLSWLQDPAFVTAQYTVLRGQHQANPQFYALTTTPSYKDATYSTAGEYCYRIIYTDQCGNLSALGDLICPLRLTGTIDNKNIITIEWNDYSGWANGVKGYTLEKFNQGGGLLKTYPMGTQTTFVDNELDNVNQVLSYRVTAEPNDPLTPSVSNLLRFTKSVNLYYPTAFTPNGDGLNDGFLVSGHFIDKIELNIFDRWGTMIYSTNKDVPWDGTFNGRLMPESTYVWTANLTDLTGRDQTHHGTVVLLKKK